MTITVIVPREQVHRGGTFGSNQFMTQSTSTTPQAVNVTDDISLLGAGTASATGGGINNLYTLAAGIEGQEKVIGLGSGTAATGMASVVFTGTATGQHVLQAAADILYMKFINDQWMLLSSLGATLSTGT